MDQRERLREQLWRDRAPGLLTCHRMEGAEGEEAITLGPNAS